MVIHQIKVLQSLASSLAEGGRGVSGTPFPISLQSHLNCMSLKVHHFAVVFVK
jgi:hypothetical protein